MQTPYSGIDYAAGGWIKAHNAESSHAAAFKSPTRRRFLRMAFVIVTAAIAAGAGALWHRVTHEHYSTQIGQLGLAELPDGSMAILNTSTEIELAFTRNVRRVRLLRGEALFDVAEDARRLFVAESDGFRVETQGTRSGMPRRDGAVAGWLVDYARDVATPLTRRTSHTLFATRGTTFTLRRKPHCTVELVVLEGSTRIGHRAPSKQDRADIDQDTLVESGAVGPLKETRVSALELAGSVAWLDRSVVLSNGATVRDAAEEINRYNQVQLLVQGSIGNRQIRGRFNVRRPEDFAVTIGALAQASIQTSDNFITIGNPETPAIAARRIRLGQP